jgi:competence protein ComEA
MNHSQQNQPQQQNQQYYLDQQTQALLRSYLVQQQQILQQSAHHVTKTPSSSPTVFPISGPPLSNIATQQQHVVQPVMPVSPTSLPVTPLPALPALPVLQDNQVLDDEAEPVPQRKRSFTKIFAITLVIALAVAIYFIWQPATTSLSTSTTGVQNNTISGVSNAGGSTGSTTGDIQVYVLGAVKSPGVYTLASTARVVDLIKAAGGPLPKANLVALNMAAKLTDGEEVYVTLVGETPPTYMGGVPSLNGGNSTPVATAGTGGTGGTSGTVTGTATGQMININTASASDMMSNLHVSSKTAQSIIDYRTQNGNYTSVAQLLQVVSRSIYDKVRSQCTV